MNKEVLGSMLDYDYVNMKLFDRIYFKHKMGQCYLPDYEICFLTRVDPYKGTALLLKDVCYLFLMNDVLLVFYILFLRLISYLTMKPHFFSLNPYLKWICGT